MHLDKIELIRRLDAWSLPDMTVHVTAVCGHGEETRTCSFLSQREVQLSDSCFRIATGDLEIHPETCRKTGEVVTYIAVYTLRGHKIGAINSSGKFFFQKADSLEHLLGYALATSAVIIPEEFHLDQAVLSIVAAASEESIAAFIVRVRPVLSSSDGYFFGSDELMQALWSWLTSRQQPYGPTPLLI